MLPDFIIYDELKRQREQRERQRHQRPQLDLELPLPYWPEREFDGPKDERDQPERGVEIIKI